MNDLTLKEMYEMMTDESINPQFYGGFWKSSKKSKEAKKESIVSFNLFPDATDKDIEKALDLFKRGKIAGVEIPIKTALNLFQSDEKNYIKENFICFFPYATVSTSTRGIYLSELLPAVDTETSFLPTQVMWTVDIEDEKPVLRKISVYERILWQLQLLQDEINSEEDECIDEGKGRLNGLIVSLEGFIRKEIHAPKTAI